MVFKAEDRTRAKKQHADAAIQLALQGRWEEAVDVNRAILESFPSDVDACNRLGKAMTELGRYADARQAYMRAIEIDPLNSIAQKNLNRLSTLGKKAPAKKANQKLSPQMFIEETGKTGITTLVNADMDAANHLTAGDQVKLANEKGNLVMRTMSGDYLGDVDTRLAQRLLKLMDSGNEYVAAISSLQDDSVKVFIRETFQHASQTGKLSFPPMVTAGFRPYVKTRLLRNDRDEEPAFDDGDEPDDWSPTVEADDDDDDDTGEGSFEIGSRRGKIPAPDMDDEIEE
ncbi:MAG: tetratricopeptide repeat protein [Dehalococcoidia bacterium]